MEGIERHAQDAEHVERRVGACTGEGHGVGRKPRALEGPAAERIAAVPDETVPPRNGEAQMVLHPPAHDDLVGVVMAEGEVVLRIGVEAQGRDGVEIAHRFSFT